ncbi:hypothetical protein B484DRAFT_400018, partial [Ochromonadaceae sp. CCMP2298]
AQVAIREAKEARRSVLSEVMLMERQMAMLEDPEFAASIPAADKAKAQKRMWALYEASAEAVAGARPSTVRRSAYMSDSTSISSADVGLEVNISRSSTSTVSEIATQEEDYSPIHPPAAAVDVDLTYDIDEDSESYDVGPLDNVALINLTGN